MRTIDDRTGLEVLGENECLLLLSRTAVGRLVVVDDGRALVFPVNYRRDGRTIVFRTDEGLKLELVSEGRAVAFEVDELVGGSRSGWSVVVSGVASEVTDERELAALARLQLHPWPPGAKARYVRIVPERLEGRRIVRLEDAHYRREDSSETCGRPAARQAPMPPSTLTTSSPVRAATTLAETDDR